MGGSGRGDARRQARRCYTRGLCRHTSLRRQHGHLPPKPRRRPSASRRAASARARTSSSTPPTRRCARSFRTVIKNVQKAVDAGDKAKADRAVQDGPADHRLGRRQGPLPQEQGRAPQEPPGRQGQGAGDRRLSLTVRQKARTRAFSCARAVRALRRQCASGGLGRSTGGDDDQVVVAREVHDEVPGHRLELAQRRVDDHALDAVDRSRGTQ